LVYEADMIKDDLTRKPKKLLLSKERIVQLSATELSHIQGGYFTYRPNGCYGQQISDYTLCATDCG
jgi:natural product precursor